MDNGSRFALFAPDGYLGASARDGIAVIRAENAQWFDLAEDINRVLQAIALRAIEVHHGASLDPAPVATRLVMRSCGSFQGAILTAERGMVTEALILARSLLESAFCMSALLDDPQRFMEDLKADAEAARREQAKFLVALELPANDAATRDQLKGVIDEIGTRPRMLSPKFLAKAGPLSKLYLAYQKLSNDAAHPSAASLHRFVATQADRSGWRYRWGPGKADEVAFAIQQASQAALTLAVGFTEFTSDQDNNDKLGPLTERFLALPAPESRISAFSIGA